MKKLSLSAFLLFSITCLALSSALAGPLHKAVKAGDLDEVKQLIASGANVNARDRFHNPPLYWAATKGQVAIAEELIAHGANINAKDKSDATALHAAASTGQVALVEFLISKGAQVDIQDRDGRTPLHKAAYTGQSATADALIAGGAKVNATTEELLTPLHLAVHQGHKKVVELLIARGAKVNLGDLEGGTPLQWAVNIGHTDIVELLKRHGGKRQEPAAEPPADAVKADIGFPSVGTKWVTKTVSNKVGVASTATFTVLDEGTYKGTPVYRVSDGVNILMFDKATRNWIAEVRAGTERSAASPYHPKYSFPLWVGKWWATNFDYYDGERGRTFFRVPWRGEVTAYEDMTVPAGTFKAFKLEGKDPAVRLDVWYSPELKIDVKTIFERFSNHHLGPGKWTTELIEHSAK